MRVNGSGAAQQPLATIAAAAAQVSPGNPAPVEQRRACGTPNPWGTGAGGVELVKPACSDPIPTQGQVFPRPDTGLPQTPAFPPIINQLLQIIQMLISLLGGKKAQAGEGKQTKEHTGAAGGAGGVPKEKMVDVAGRQAVKVDGPQGFLWKPTSDSDHKAVLLLPKGMAGKVKSAVVRDANGNVVMKGSLKGQFGDGRDIFRFPKNGESMPPNCTVEVQLQDGTTKNWKIGDPSLRHD